MEEKQKKRTYEQFFTIKPGLIIDQLCRDYRDMKDNLAEELFKIESEFGPLDELVPYYVIPNGQNVNPADKPEEDTGLVANNNMFELLNRFLAGSRRFSHAIIMSDAGMGKTSLLVVLKLLHLDKLVEDEYHVELLKIGPKVLNQISVLSDPAHTVLLLDALDEDPEAWERFYTRLQEILRVSAHFRKTVITTRTQFFPFEYEEDGRAPGVINLHGFHCSKLFLSPFDNGQVEEYLRNRFNDSEERKRAKSIVENMRSLKFRPMLLSYIDLLIARESPYDCIYSLYDELIDEWLNRELRKGTIESKLPLRKACRAIANYMYCTKERDVTRGKIIELCSDIKELKYFQDMAVEGRSLLQRTSEGGYKFAHYSILEYFIAETLGKNPKKIINTDQVVSFLQDQIIHRNLRNVPHLDLSTAKFEDVDISKLHAHATVLERTHFTNCDLSRSTFSNASLQNTLIKRCRMVEVNLCNANIDGASFIETDMKGARMPHLSAKDFCVSGSKLSNANLKGAVFASSNLRKVELKNTVIENLSLIDVDLTKADLSGSTFVNCSFNNVNFTDAQMGCCAFPGIHFYKVIFNKADLSTSNLDGCHMETTTLNNASFTKASIRKIKATMVIGNGTNFAESLASEADFTDSEITSASFEEAYLARACFRRSKLHNTSFSHSDLEEADFYCASAESASFNKTNMIKCNMEQANLRRASFSNAVLTRANMKDADLSQANLELLDLSSVALDRACLNRANLSGSRLQNLRGNQLKEAYLRGAILAGADLENANLMLADLRDVDGESANFRGANLEKANLQKAKLRTTILIGANLSGANLCGCDLSKAKMDGAITQGVQFDEQTRLPEDFKADLKP